MTSSAPLDIAKASVLIMWLYIVAAMVVAIVIIGGLTRLTESGLSITEWQLATGILPPLSEAAWLREFEKYQQIPEYQQVNRGMALADFKEIYFWEWLHRLWGRLIGLAIALPLGFFAWKRWIPSGFGWRLVGLLILVCVQGAIGWWMVTSGLSERTDVSHFRLAIHLLVALALLSAVLWTARDMSLYRQRFLLAQDSASHDSSGSSTSTSGSSPSLSSHSPPPRRAALILTIAVTCIFALQLLFGAWMAGLNAGQVANSWPLMNERFFPEGIDWSQGGPYAASHDPFLIHFLHRWLAWLVAGLLGLVAWQLYRQQAPRLAWLLVLAIVAQIASGILTVQSGTALAQAAFHQAIGAVLVVITTLALHRLYRPYP